MKPEYSLVYENDKAEKFNCKKLKSVSRYEFEDGTTIPRSRLDMEYFYVGRYNKYGEFKPKRGEL